VRNLTRLLDFSRMRETPRPTGPDQCLVATGFSGSAL